MSLESRKGTALEDPGAELVGQVTSFWDQYGRVVIGVVVAVIAIAAIATYTVKSGADRNNRATDKLAEANSLFWNGDYARSKSTADEVVKQFGSTANGNDARRIAGDASFWKGDWKEAITQYKAYLAKDGSGIVAQSVRRSLGYACESEKQYAEAGKLYDQLVGVFERESSGEMLAASARCYEALGNKAEATKRLQRLLAEFGETSYAARARVKVAELQSSGS